MGNFLLPVERDRLVRRVVLPLDQFAIGDRFEAFGNRDDDLGALPLIGFVDARNPVAIGRGFALAPDQERSVGVCLGGSKEVESIFGILNPIGHFEGSGLPRMKARAKINEQLFAIRSNASGIDRFLAQLHRDMRDLEIHYVQTDGLSRLHAAECDGGLAVHHLLRQVDAKIEADIIDSNWSIAGRAQRLDYRCLASCVSGGCGRVRGRSTSRTATGRLSPNERRRENDAAHTGCQNGKTRVTIACHRTSPSWLLAQSSPRIECLSRNVRTTALVSAPVTPASSGSY